MSDALEGDRSLDGDAHEGVEASASFRALSADGDPLISWEPTA